MKTTRRILGAAALSLAGCATAPPPSTAPASTGAAGGGVAVGADASLQTCPETVGTVRLQDGMSNGDTGGRQAGDSALESLRGLLRDVNQMQQDRSSQGVTIDSLRLLIQQSNCLLIVERGLGESAASDEKRRARSPNSEVRDDANMGQGQEVAADFVLRALVKGVNANEQSSSLNLGAVLPWKLASGASVGRSISSADVQLVLVDVRSKVQLAVAEGHGSGENTSLATGVLGRVGAVFGGAGVKSESKTSGQKVMLQAYADAYNKLVPALRNYKTQTVRGGAGAGGTLGVQGARNDASRTAK